MIKILSHDSISEYEHSLKSFFKAVPFGRYLSDRKLDNKQAINFEYDLLVKYVSKGEVTIELDESLIITGLVGFHFSEWDTLVFKKRTSFLQYFLIKENNFNIEKKLANQLISLFHDWARRNSIDVVITKIDTKYFTPILVLQEQGYIFYETITYKSIEVVNQDIVNFSNIKYRFAIESDKEELKKLALKNTFKKSHFYLDSNFDVDQVEEMYSSWITNALNSDQKILVIDVNSRIAGVFIYDSLELGSYFGKKIGSWKFAAVDGRFREKGIGMDLFKATMHACIVDNNDIIDSTLVEKNIISQNFHDKLGFRLVNTLYTFHKWFVK